MTLELRLCERSLMDDEVEEGDSDRKGQHDVVKARAEAG
jgi:hypothetical protein